jgi:DNA repair exonuclease SbcCD nuclease subunit
MRFAHLSDTHLGYRQYNLDKREDDFYKAFHKCIDKIIDEKCDFVIHSGDLFDEPRPHIRALVEVRKAIDKLHDSGIEFITVAGNHDILMRKGSLIPHALYKRIKVLTPKNPVKVIGDVFIGGLPYHSKIHINALKDSLKLLSKKSQEYGKRILVMHQGIDKYFGLEYELKFGDVPKGFDYYAFGHIHKRIEDEFEGGKIVYPGSTEIWRVDELVDFEKNRKGFVLVDTDDFSIKRVDIDIRPFIKLEVESTFDLNEIKHRIAGKKKPILYVTVKTDDQRYQTIYRELNRELSNKVLYIDIKKKNISKEETRFTEAVDLRDLINEMMEGYKGEEKDFAYSLFKTLSSGDIEAAFTLTEDFYRVWDSNAQDIKNRGKAEAPSKIKEVFQSSLEAYR